MTNETSTATPASAEKTASLKRSRGTIKRQLTSSENTLASINENTNFATLNLE